MSEMMVEAYWVGLQRRFGVDFSNDSKLESTTSGEAAAACLV
uniref:Uncharacterized protein n=1 Tax=Manihot esculenta TaxID=3983 RepID=A0A2C9UFU4_MANES